MKDKKPGDNGTCQLRYTVKAMDPEGVDLIVEAVVPEGYEVDEDTDGNDVPAVNMNATSSGLTPTAMMVRKMSDSK